MGKIQAQIICQRMQILNSMKWCLTLLAITEMQSVSYHYKPTRKGPHDNIKWQWGCKETGSFTHC